MATWTCGPSHTPPSGLLVKEGYKFRVSVAPEDVFSLEGVVYTFQLSSAQKTVRYSAAEPLDTKDPVCLWMRKVLAETERLWPPS